MTHDDQLLTLLKDLPLPSDPADRYTSVVARRRRSDRTRTVVVAAALSVVTVTGAVAALTRDTSTTSLPGDVLSSTEVRTAHVRFTNTAGSDHELAGTASGVVDFQHDAFEITMDQLGQRIVLRKIGKDLWVSGTAVTLGGADLRGKHWLHLTEAAFGGGSSLSAFDPTTLLAGLRAGGVRLDKRGTATVGGVQTTVYDVTGVDDSKEGPFADGDGQVYVDGDGLVRRTVSTGSNDATTTSDFSDFGAPVRIVPPDPADVAEQDDVSSSLSSTFGGSGSSDGTTSFGQKLTPEQQARLCDQTRAMLAKEHVPADRQAELLKVVCPT